MRYCLQPACAELVVGGYCARHRTQWNQRHGSAHSRGYTRRWSARAALFRRLHPLCGQRADGRPPVLSRCHEQGRVTLATCVDHVVPHDGDPTLFWDESNWQSLCNACHARKTDAGL